MPLKKLESVDYIVIHCSATRPGMDIGKAEIEVWHRQRKMVKIGYHLVIRRDGVIEQGRALDEMGAHARGVNQHSIGVCMVGGVDDKLHPQNNFTDIQWEAMRYVLKFLTLKHPEATIIGHRDVPGTNKACPSFDVSAFLSDLDLEIPYGFSSDTD